MTCDLESLTILEVRHRVARQTHNLPSYNSQCLDRVALFTCVFIIFMALIIVINCIIVIVIL